MEFPLQTNPLFTVIIGKGFTITEVVAVFVQPFASVPVTVYEVVIVGVAVTGVPLEELKPVEGFHV